MAVGSPHMSAVVSGPDRVVFEYAILRIVPRAEREECLNVGVLVYCQAADLLVAATHLDERRLSALADDLDLDAVRAALAGVARVCAGGEDAGAAAASGQGERVPRPPHPPR